MSCRIKADHRVFQFPTVDKSSNLIHKTPIYAVYIWRVIYLDPSPKKGVISIHRKFFGVTHLNRSGICKIF